MAAYGFVAVVGARALPEARASQVAEVVRFFVGRGWGIGSGGARGADEYALRAVLATGREACSRSVVFLPGSLAESCSGLLRAFVKRGGRVVEGSGSGREALLSRSRWLARESAGVVAFLWGPSRGSVFTLREAARAGKPVAVILAGGGAELPSFSGGLWETCALGPVSAFRWVAEASEEAEPKPTALARIFVVPEGEPVHDLLAHISSLSQGERLWFEQGVLAGDTVLVPHERLDDGKPARLAVDRLMRRLRCSAREAFDLGECLLALEADAGVIAHYEAEARRRGVGPVIEDLVHLIASLVLPEPVPDSDALDHAERLGDRAEWATADGRLAQSAVLSGAELAQLAWHQLGSVQPETVKCPVCSALYPADDEAADLPACPTCGTRDTWEARPPPLSRWTSFLGSSSSACRGKAATTRSPAQWKTVSARDHLDGVPRRWPARPGKDAIGNARTSSVPTTSKPSGGGHRHENHPTASSKGRVVAPADASQHVLLPHGRGLASMPIIEVREEGVFGGRKRTTGEAVGDGQI